MGACSRYVGSHCCIIRFASFSVKPSPVRYMITDQLKPHSPAQPKLQGQGRGNGVPKLEGQERFSAHFYRHRANVKFRQRIGGAPFKPALRAFFSPKTGNLILQCLLLDKYLLHVHSHCSNARMWMIECLFLYPSYVLTCGIALMKSRESGLAWINELELELELEEQLPPLPPPPPGSCVFAELWRRRWCKALVDPEGGGELWPWPSPKV